MRGADWLRGDGTRPIAIQATRPSSKQPSGCVHEATVAIQPTSNLCKPLDLVTLQSFVECRFQIRVKDQGERLGVT